MQDNHRQLICGDVDCTSCYQGSNHSITSDYQQIPSQWYFNETSVIVGAYRALNSSTGLVQLSLVMWWDRMDL